MDETVASSGELLPHLFRLAYSKMTAVLYRHFGLSPIEIAEDIVSDTFLKATEVWPVKGIPPNPEAWLYTVAGNKAKDYLKRQQTFEQRVRGRLSAETWSEPEFGFDQQTITDSQLAMIFTVCNPVISAEAQICLALQILCGFSVEEIADAFLTQKETIKKRLLRARAALRKDDFQIGILAGEALTSRLDKVLRTLYLLFNEGYYSKSGEQLVRKDLCSEAIRLAVILTGNTMTNRPETNALLALMCYQSSRLEAREDDAGRTVLFEEQDKTLWSRELIDRGNYYMLEACTGKEASKYHLEAGIAYWHTMPSDAGKWQHILQLYNALIVTEYSPPAAVNRTFAYARVHGNERAIPEAEKLGLEHNSEYHALLAYLYTGLDKETALDHYLRAIRLSKSLTERQNLQRAADALMQDPAES